MLSLEAFDLFIFEVFFITGDYCDALEEIGKVLQM